MNSIPPSHASAASPLNRASSYNRDARTDSPRAPQSEVPRDTAEISREAVAYARRLEISGQRIHEIRTQIAEGVYDTPERLDAALDKMIDALGEE